MLKMKNAIEYLCNQKIKKGLLLLCEIPGVQMVIASKVYRFVAPESGTAIDRHSSYFFNSLPSPALPVLSSDFFREWSDGKHTSSRLAIYSPSRLSHNMDEFCTVYIPLCTSIAIDMNRSRNLYRCAATRMNKDWLPADVEMAAFYWWGANGSR